MRTYTIVSVYLVGIAAPIAFAAYLLLRIVG